MKLTFITSALAAALGCALACAPVTVQAQATTSTSPSPAPAMDTKEKKKSDYTPYKGTVTAMDATSITVKGTKGEMKLMADASTTYKVSNKKAAMTDIKVGDKVTGSYMTSEDGTMMAHSVHKKM